MSFPQVYYWPATSYCGGAIFSGTYTTSTVPASGSYLPLNQTAIMQVVSTGSSTAKLVPYISGPHPIGSIDPKSGYPRHTLVNMWRTLSFQATGGGTFSVIVTGKGSARCGTEFDYAGLSTSTPVDPIPVPLSITYSVTGGGGTTYPTDYLWTEVDNIQITGFSNSLTNLQIGYGPTGITNFCFLDYNRIFYAATGQIQTTLINSDTIGGSYSVTPLVSLTRPEVPNPHVGKFDIHPPTQSINLVITGGAGSSIPFFGVYAPIPGTLPVTAPIQLNPSNPQAIFPLGAWGAISPLTLTCLSIGGNTVESIYYSVLQQGIRT